ncbi:MAG: aminotransferase class IV [Verrucomicrobiota bacterium]
MTRVWNDGAWIPAADFAVAPSDRGLLHGLGLFEAMLAIDGNLPLWDRHQRRLESSCARLGWMVDVSEVPQAVAEMTAGGKRTFRVRVGLTAGSGRMDELQRGSDFLQWLTVMPADDPPKIVRLGICPWRRNSRSPLAGLKCASYAANLLALDYARRMNCDDLLWANELDELCEASTANVFLVSDGTLVTPALASGCLPGIAREVICEHAQRHGIRVLEQRVKMNEADEADEIILTNSVRGPVQGVVGGVKPPGPVLEVLQESWRAAGLG